MINPALTAAARALLELCRERKLKITTAESCTGGLVAATLTDIPGSSDIVDRAFVTYSNAAKQAMLGVPPALLERFGAVSQETAEAMARGALAHAPVQLAVSITGIAGPGGAVPGKPVGLVLPHPTPCSSGTAVRRHRTHSGAGSFGGSGAGHAARFGRGRVARTFVSGGLWHMPAKRRLLASASLRLQ
jgi:PncC family amidohydrolase